MIPDTVDLHGIQPKQGGSAHPPGTFDFIITNTYLQENGEKTGAMLNIEFTSPVGMIINRYNVIHPNQDTVRISNEQLSALGHAINIYQVAYPKLPDGGPNMQMAGHTLRGGRGKMEIVPQLDKEGKPNGYMKINKVFDSNGNEPGKTTSAPAPMTQQTAGGGWNNNPQLQQQPQQQATPVQQQQPNVGWANQQPQPSPGPAAGNKPAWAQ